MLDKYYKFLEVIRISTSVIRSNMFLEGKIYVHAAIKEIKYANIDDIWLEKEEDRTYQVYLHSLNMLNYLAVAFKETGEQKFYDSILKVINSWINYGAHTKHVNHEQAVSTRLIHFINLYDIIKDKKLLKNMIVTHVHHLLEDKNYIETNHGIMIDRGLSKALPFLLKNDKELYMFVLQTVILRCRNTINRDFSMGNLHLENSTDYHRLAVKWLERIEMRLNEVNETLGSRYVKKLERAKALDEIIVSPNKRYPIIGDSSDGAYYGNKSYNNLIDFEAGRAVIHNEKFNSQLTFICGYGRKGHKHHDDLSFLFFDGHEYMFNDSGKYNYQKNNVIRQHMISPDAHNSFYKVDELYPISDLQHVREKVKIVSFEDFGDYYRIVGQNNAYENLNLKRTIIYIKKTNAILLIDSFNSNIQNTIGVNFNLGLGVKAERISRGEYILKGNHNNTLKLKGHIGRYTDTIIEDGKKHQSKISNKFNTFDSNQRVIYRQKTLKGFFVTSISSVKDNIQCEKVNNQYLKIQVNDTEFFTLV